MYPSLLSAGAGPYIFGEISYPGPMLREAYHGHNAQIVVTLILSLSSKAYQKPSQDDLRRPFGPSTKQLCLVGGFLIQHP